MIRIIVALRDDYAIEQFAKYINIASIEVRKRMDGSTIMLYSMEDDEFAEAENMVQVMKKAGFNVFIKEQGNNN